MIIHKYKVELDNYWTDKWLIYPIGDIHWGHQGCDKVALRQTIRKVADNPYARWIGMGDYGEFIGYRHPYFDPSSVDKSTMVWEMKQWARREVGKIANELYPIKDKCIGILRGNHEKFISDRGDIDPAQELAEKLQTKYLGYECMIRVYVLSKNDGKNRYSFVIYAHHGFGSGKKPGSHMNNLLDLATSYNANLYIMGHVHRMQSMITTRLELNTSGKFVSRPLGFINSGTYLKTKQKDIEGYEVKKGLPPTVIGTPRIGIIGNDNNQLKFELTIQHGAQS